MDERMKTINSKASAHLDSLLGSLENNSMTVDDVIAQACGVIIALILMGIDPDEIVEVSEQAANLLMDKMDEDELTNQTE